MRTKQAERHKRWRKRNPHKAMWKNARERSRRDDVVFTITPEDIPLPLPSHCPVLGIPLVHPGCGAPDRGSGFHNDSCSIDRKDPNKGYVPGNIAIISLRANRLKCDATSEELEKILEYIKQCE